MRKLRETEERRRNRERKDKSLAALKDAGGSVVLVALSPEATRKLAKMTSGGATKREAIEAALLQYGKR